MAQHGSESGSEVEVCMGWGHPYVQQAFFWSTWLPANSETNVIMQGKRDRAAGKIGQLSILLMFRGCRLSLGTCIDFNAARINSR